MAMASKTSPLPTTRQRVDLVGRSAHGNFSAAINFATGDCPSSVAVGDFNGDGKQDLAVANSGSDNVSILLGDGAGNFSAPTNFGVGDLPISVAVGDFDGDGKQDLATANSFIRQRVDLVTRVPSESNHSR